MNRVKTEKERSNGEEKTIMWDGQKEWSDGRKKKRNNDGEREREWSDGEDTEGSRGQREREAFGGPLCSKPHDTDPLRLISDCQQIRPIRC